MKNEIYVNKKNGAAAELVKLDLAKGTCILKMEDGTTKSISTGTLKRWWSLEKSEPAETVKKEEPKKAEKKEKKTEKESKINAVDNLKNIYTQLINAGFEVKLRKTSVNVPKMVDIYSRAFGARLYVKRELLESVSSELYTFVKKEGARDVISVTSENILKVFEQFTLSWVVEEKCDKKRCRNFEQLEREL